MEIIVGTNNEGKLQEMQQAVNDQGVRFVSYQKYGLSAIMPAENGASYEENAYQKALVYQRQIKRPVLTDDGGLELAAFPDLLGLHTHRFFKSSKPQAQNQELLDLFAGKKLTRKLTLRATLLYLMGTQKIITSASLQGELAFEPKGTGGYGFDSIIYLPNEKKTLAQLTAEARATYSPRIQALRQMIKKLGEAQL